MITTRIEVSLDEFDDDDIAKYAKRYLGLTNIGELSDDALMDELEERGYNLDIAQKDNIDNIDYTDKKRIDEITEKFLTASWQEREEMYERLLRK